MLIVNASNYQGFLRDSVQKKGEYFGPALNKTFMKKVLQLQNHIVDKLEGTMEDGTKVKSKLTEPVEQR
ncbi:unnamed protein product [Cyprideis torosa]|uniref:Uncharacterized protein n=1 Tax=Cyprideis torosa TaxID=163714 RepID=A0A7R8ZRT1_9CRUS|nr:unnamed protein product [Cyprideis torosa]CAG0905419.1 unnamed protein product [Cyprideis torosa]